MSEGIIFVLETSGEDKSDDIYLQAVLDHYYDVRGIPIARVYLGGKQNYNSPKARGRIKSLLSMFASQGSHMSVVYLIDVDSSKRDFDKGSFFSNIREYCDLNSYSLAWFCRDIEEVFLGKRGHDTKGKLWKAKGFMRDNLIASISEANLKAANIQIGQSNVLLILDQYLPRKKRL